MSHHGYARALGGSHVGPTNTQYNDPANDIQIISDPPAPYQSIPDAKERTAEDELTMPVILHSSTRKFSLVSFAVICVSNMILFAFILTPIKIVDGKPDLVNTNVIMWISYSLVGFIFTIVGVLVKESAKKKISNGDATIPLYVTKHILTTATIVLLLIAIALMPAPLSSDNIYGGIMISLGVVVMVSISICVILLATSGTTPCFL